MSDEEPHLDALRSDPHLGPLVEEQGPITLNTAEDVFERLVVSLVRQQVSMEAAAAIRERLFDRFEVTPETMRDADPERLADAGLSEAKAEYVKSAAARFDDAEYDHASFEGLSDEEVQAELTEIRGVGPWTAKMFLMFALGREDVFPVEDLGIRKGMWAVYDDSLTRAEMVERAADWRPYRSYASLYLWRVADGSSDRR